MKKVNGLVELAVFLLGWAIVIQTADVLTQAVVLAMGMVPTMGPMNFGQALFGAIFAAGVFSLYTTVTGD